VSDFKTSAVDPKQIARLGGMQPGVAAQVHREAGVPEAQVYGVGTFYSLLAQPQAKVRICQGLSCQLAGAAALLRQAHEAGLPAEPCNCLAACDRPCAVLRDRTVLPAVTSQDLVRAQGRWEKLYSAASPASSPWTGQVHLEHTDPGRLAIHLAGVCDHSGAAFARAQQLGAEEVLNQLAASGLQGRGGAGFPAVTKWKTVRAQPETVRYVVLNADESEPGTFKDREILLRRPDLVLEGLAIAAQAVGAQEVCCYFRGEFEQPMVSVAAALEEFTHRGTFGALRFRLHGGHGGYICGEETALLEALEGRRPLPRIKPPYPGQAGLWGKPTLIQNVETIAMVPGIVRNGGAWFKGLGKTAPGTKLYSISGHVQQPGVYELPLGSTLDEVLAAAGGCSGALKAFQPGGAASGFLSAAARTLPLDFETLDRHGSMLGSGGIVVLDSSADLAAAVRTQLAFFESESCGQCAPCRIGTRFLLAAYDRWLEARSRKDPAAGAHLAQVKEVAWEMNEGSICGLGQTAFLPLTSAIQHFPEVFGI